MSIFSDINRVQLLGNVTQEVELRYTAGGTAVATISVATNRDFKSGDEWQKETTFHNIVLWGKLAEHAKERCNKGTRVIIEGRIANRSWEDKDGNKRYKTEVVADEMILIDRYNKREGGAAPRPETKVENAQAADEYVDPDDLPF